MINLVAEKSEIPVPEKYTGAILVDSEGKVWAYCRSMKEAKMLEIDHKARRLLSEISETLLWAGGSLSEDAWERMEKLRLKINRLDRGEE